jgi:hypothetical protein
MTTELSNRRDHLGSLRRRIIGRSLAAAAAGSLPVPLVEEWLASRIQRGTIRRIAEHRGVDLDDDAVRALADGPSSPPEWLELAGGTLVSRLAARSLRRFVWAYVVARRARAATRAFLIATLFDHYCARLHIGLGLDAGQGATLRALMERSLAETPGGLARRAFARGALAAARVSVRAPLQLANAVTRGWLRRQLSRGDEVTAVAEVDRALEQQLAGDSVLSRSAAAIEAQLSAEANPYLDDLIDAFERRWRAHTAGEP